MVSQFRQEQERELARYRLINRFTSEYNYTPSYFNRSNQIDYNHHLSATISNNNKNNWTCLKCTYINEPHHKICKMCNNNNNNSVRIYPNHFNNGNNCNNKSNKMNIKPPTVAEQIAYLSHEFYETEKMFLNKMIMAVEDVVIKKPTGNEVKKLSMRSQASNKIKEHLNDIFQTFHLILKSHRKGNFILLYKSTAWIPPPFSSPTNQIEEDDNKCYEQNVNKLISLNLQTARAHTSSIIVLIKEEIFKAINRHHRYNFPNRLLELIAEYTIVGGLSTVLLYSVAPIVQRWIIDYQKFCSTSGIEMLYLLRNSLTDSDDIAWFRSSSITPKQLMYEPYLYIKRYQRFSSVLAEATINTASAAEFATIKTIFQQCLNKISQ